MMTHLLTAAYSTRILSPIPGMTADSLANACACIKSTDEADGVISIAKSDAKNIHIEKRSTCSSAKVATVKSEFKYPTAFCSFYNARYVTLSGASEEIFDI